MSSKKLNRMASEFSECPSRRLSAIALLRYWYATKQLPTATPVVKWLNVHSVNGEFMPPELWKALRRAVRKELMQGASGWDEEDWAAMCYRHRPFFRKGSKINYKIVEHFIEEAKCGNDDYEWQHAWNIAVMFGYSNDTLPMWTNFVEQCESRAETFSGGMTLYDYGRKVSGLRLMDKYGTFKDWDNVQDHEDRTIRQHARNRMVALAHASGNMLELIRVSHIDNSAQRKAWAGAKRKKNLGLLFSFLTDKWTFCSSYWFSRFREVLELVSSDEDFELLEEFVIWLGEAKGYKDHKLWERIFKVLDTKLDTKYFV